MELGEKRLTIIMAIVVSLLIHVFALHALALPGPANDGLPPRIIELTEFPPPLDVSIQKPEPLKDLQGQVVDLGAPSPDDPNPPDDSNYLAERNMRTEHESIKPSRARTGSPGAVMPPARRAASRPRKPGSQERPAADASRGENGGEVEVSGEAGKDADAGKPGAELTREDFRISMSEIKQTLAGDDGSIDYVPGVVHGDITSLNARQYAYASFYNRIKKIIRFYWEPGRAVENLNWSGVTLETRLRVVITDDGALESVDVVKSCGYPVVDAAAIRAMRKAAPFYNVPPGLLDENKKLDEVWAFYIVSQ